MRFILLHSPLTGPAAWTPVAAELARRGVEATVPAIPPLAVLAAPYYDSLARAVAVQALGQGGPFILAVHSAAGGLAPGVVAARYTLLLRLPRNPHRLPPTPPMTSCRRARASPRRKTASMHRRWKAPAVVAR